jgi:NADH-quinone oxidoreductase subunit N
VNTTDLVAILPLLLMMGTPIVVMLVVAVGRNHTLTTILSLLGLAAAFASLWGVAPLTPRRVTPLLIVDHYAVFYMGLILAASFAVVLLAHGYLAKQETNREELYILLLVATLGSLVLVASNHLVSFFLGLELLSVALYILISYLYTRRLSLEAGIKYLVLAAASAAFLLFGMALVYTELGTMEFARIVAILSAGPDVSYGLLVPGFILITTGIGYKLALVPFHMWTPDVYEGAPAPVAAFVATVSKGAMFALLLRYFYQTGASNYGPVFVVFSIIAIASMFAGNLLALLQSNVKRILAYSSIAHLGYLLVAFQAGGTAGAEAATFYLVAYFITMLGAFGVVTVLSAGERDADSLEAYRGLFWRRPVLSSVFTVMLLSLAGIPVTAGFVGKVYIIASGASSALWSLIIILIVTSVIGLYYYLRIVVAMYTMPEGAEEAAAAAPSLSLTGGFALGALTVLLIWFGVYPSPLLDMIRATAASL